MKSHGYALLAVFLSAFPARADVTLSKIFSDHAVLQRDLPLPIWGTAEPGEKVTVKLGDAQAATTADAMGKWSLKLPAMKMNALGQDMIVTGKNTVTVKDVLIGDVWLCGGQSNMQLPLKDCDAKDDIATADFPTLRCLTTTNIPSRSKPPTDVVGAWAVCTPANAPSFTGTGFYFARRLLKETGVPMGLIEVSFGGTQIEASIAPEGFDLEPWLKQQPGYAAMLRQPDHIALEAVYNAKVKLAVPYGIKGALWYQGEWNGGDTAYYRKMRTIVGGRAKDQAAASTSEMARFETEILSTQENLKHLMDLPGKWIDQAHRHRTLTKLILDMDSSVSETYGRQEGTAYNGHFVCTC